MNMKQLGRIVVGCVSLSVLVGSAYGLLHAQDITDWWRLRGYQPSTRIVQLADHTTMKPEARKVFYVQRPKLDDKPSFRQHCPSHEQSIVLGCYVSNSGVYLLDVTDQRLNGVIEVTAAHEFLHAEYDRLSKEEQARVDKMTAEFFAGLNNQRLKDTIERYRADDPAVVPNELHSILGTEVRDLSPELEKYYGQYFSDRKQIVSFSEKYERTFVDLENQVKSYDSQLVSLKKQIETNQVSLKKQNDNIDTERRRLDELLRQNQSEQYNAAVPEFNSLVHGYNELVVATKSLIEKYNSLVEERNAIATAEQELIEAINSKIQTKETQ
jgi:hypothetical protein